MIWIGTSGYNYPEWKGHFYPSDLPAAKMLPYYAARFPSVEINYTFYRMPTVRILANWARETPDGFRFSLKAPRRITHDQRLRSIEDSSRDTKSRSGSGFGDSCQNTDGAPIDIRWALLALVPPEVSPRGSL